ncbi:MAG TPA: endolytic transglycosylase MltG [Candidatus Saccharimonadales bacterium]|nr:endolytic transglycosylase MltG [Candidatus Saccharimonadales bacterium]
MGFYSLKRRRTNWRKVVVSVVAAALVVTVAAGFTAWGHYRSNLRPRDNDQTTYNIVIPTGSTPRQIGSQLKVAGLIRDGRTFEIYVRVHNFTDKLQAGTYAISSSMSVQQIVSKIANGDIVKNLLIILPAQRIDQIKDVFINAKFDKVAVDKAFGADQYRDIPVLADLPAGASLEGYLYPDTFQKDATTDPAVIIRQSLQEMNSHVTADVKAAFAAKGLSTYQGITLASIVENEVSKPSDRQQVAQVFLSRLKQGIRLQSDITANYASLVGDDAYNMYNHDGLPPGPISNVSDVSLQAVAHPANTNWLYFVTGDNGTTYFSSTSQEHEKLVQQYCHKLCGR